jgi:hypothetical protein
MSQFNIRPYEQLASYDKPQVLLTQALDNEFTLKGALQTLVDSDGLSPLERDSFTDRLKDQIGRNSVTDAMVDIVTNPFVLLMAVTTPVGGQALSRTGKAIFDLGGKFSPLIKEQGGLHAALGFLAPMQLFRGTALTPAVQSFTKGVSQLEEELMARVSKPLKKVLEEHGLESLNPEMIRDPVKRAKAEELNDALYASLAGMDKEVKTSRTKLVRMMPGGEKFVSRKRGGKHTLKDWKQKGSWGVEVVEETAAPIVSANMDAVIDRLKLTELRDSYRDAMAQRRMRLFGDEAASAAAGTFVPDEQKLLRAWQGVKMGLKNDGAFKGTGAEMAAVMLGPEMAEQIARGSVDKDLVIGQLKKLISGQPEFYMPRNVIDLKGAKSMQDILEQRRSRSLVATGSTLNRTSTLGTWDPDDLDRLFSRFGRTEVGDKMLARARKKVQAINDRGDIARTYRINAQESLSRYFRDTGVTHSLYVQTEDQLPKLAQALKDSRVNASPDKLKTISREMPVGGLLDPNKKSLARVMQEEHFLLEDRFAKESLETILRGATGVQKIEHVATHMALIKGKQVMRSLLDSGIGKAMKASGKWGEGLYKRLDDSINAELTFGEAKGISGALARYFYVTHLGVNLASVTMNMMQPLLLAANYGGLGNVMKAYTSAFGELGGYISERVGKHGFKALTDDQHLALIQKHFKYANVDGENLLQIGRDSFSTLDNISYKTDLLAGVGRQESYLYDYPMKLFEKAEWLNRSVAAHSVENLYRSKGLIPTKGSETYYRMIRDVDEMVSATQFGGNTLNTPMAFQGVGPFGRLGNNPLFRQFLSFPLRSTTSLTYEAGRLGERGALKGITQDFIRGMGISAIFYEVGKNTFGIDLSPGLYGASLTQAVGGDRFFQSGNEYIPIPPVVDIPINLVRGALDPGQRVLLQNNIPRLIPGGVALSRALNLAPSAYQDPIFALPGSLQKTYIDPNQRTEDGKIAVFKSDGTLIDYQSPGMIFAKQLGVDMGQFKQTSDFDGYLLKNRDQIVEYRRRAIAALLANEIPKMQGIRNEFKRRFGMELTISKDQLDEAMKNRTVSRTERILDRMPPDQRALYQQMAVDRAGNMGLPEEAITASDTARQRAQARRLEAPTLTPEQQQVVATEPGFTGFSGY